MLRASEILVTRSRLAGGVSDEEGVDVIVLEMREEGVVETGLVG